MAAEVTNQKPSVVDADKDTRGVAAEKAQKNAPTVNATINSIDDSSLKNIQDVTLQVVSALRQFLNDQNVPLDFQSKIIASVVSKISEESLYKNIGKLLKNLNDVFKESIQLEEKEEEKEQDKEKKEERQRFIQCLRIIQENADKIASFLSKQILAPKVNDPSADKQPDPTRSYSYTKDAYIRWFING